LLRIALFALGLAVVPARAMFEDNETGVRPEGMAGAFTAVADDISAVDFNPAGLFQVGSRSFAASYKLLFGGAAGLHTEVAGVVVPAGRLGTAAVRIQETGFELQSQRSLKLAHGVKLAEGLALGLGLTGYNLWQKDFGQGFAVGVDIGMFGRIYRYWTAGFYVHNVNMPRIGTSDLPRLLVFGLGYSPQPGIQSALDVSKEPGMPTRISVGQEFRIIQDHLYLRAGVQTEPVRMCFGLRAGARRVHADYALQTHSVLPLTHDFGVAFEF
jgi:hypothetical protein